MVSLRTAPPEPADGAAETRTALLLIAGLTLLHILALFRTPLELFPDEAQYWLWSRTLAFGYFSQPPIIAWAIRATTAFGGDAEPWVRLPAALFQAAAATCVYVIGRRLYGGRVGLLALGLYGLAPAIQLSSTVVATDAPMACFMGLSLVAYLALQAAQGSSRMALSAGLGATLGLALLSDYAAACALIGIGLHLALVKPARQAWSPATAALALGVLAAVLTPNLAWRAAHGFSTFQHTAPAANWIGWRLFNLKALGEGLASQVALFGPVPFAGLVAGAAILASNRRLQAPDVALICFALPPILIAAIQAFVSRAGANLSEAFYIAGAVLAAAWLSRWSARGWIWATLALQGLIAAGVFAVMLDPGLADALGQSDKLKLARGWDQTARSVMRKARSEAIAGLSSVAVNNRLLYDELAYYGRDDLAEPLAPKLTIWIRSPAAGDQADVSAPLGAKVGQRVLAVAYEGEFSTEMASDFSRVLRPEIDDVFLDKTHRRTLEMFVGEGFLPQPRDPQTGYPSPKWTPGSHVQPKL